MFSLIKKLLFLIIVAVIVGLLVCSWRLNRPLNLNSDLVDVEIAKGSSSKVAVQQLLNVGVSTPDVWLLYAWIRLNKQGNKLRAGSYEIPTGISLVQMLDFFVSGKQATRKVSLIEGWTMRQFREQLAKAPNLKPDTVNYTNEQIMAKLGAPDLAAEGQFFPDTYVYQKNSSDFVVLKAAFDAMQQRLEQAWQVRDTDVPLKNKQELLILASIVEKETGLESDRGLVAGVFSNRLRKGMLLQTDPTVIYGVSEAKGQEFSGRIRYTHLRDDNLWNTYVHTGLPPTPIAMPGNAALIAAAKPEKTNALFFVATGQGKSHFSETLTEHNKAVDKYIKNKAQ